MNMEQIRARLGEISARLGEISAAADEISEEQLTELNDLNAEFETLSGKLATLEKAQANVLAATATKGRKTDPAPATERRIEVGASGTDRFGGFKSSGEFLMAVKASSGGQIHEKFRSAAYEKNGEDGGFLVPEDINTAIVKKLESSESLLGETRQFKVSGNGLSFPVDESQPWNSGVTARWTGEGAQIGESKPKFTTAQLRLHKLAALVNATDELLDDATALESYIKQSAPAAITHKINSAILTGDGVGKPEGLLLSPFTVQVAKEGAQAADTIEARNILKMYSAMIPSARAGAKWYINAAAEPQLLMLKDDNGNFIYLSPGSQMNQTPYGLLMGRPVIPMLSSMPALGDSGDILFANLDYYYAILKSTGVKSATSIHAYFDREITSFRFSLRIDGKVPFRTPVTTEFGNYQMSAFVKLEAR